MIDVMEIMKQIEHMATSTQEIEKQAEAFRLIQERADEKRRISSEKHEKTIMELRILMQEIRARTPKRQIYFGKVKTE